MPDGPEGPLRADDLRLSVVLCAYTLERWSDIEQAVASLRRQTVAPAQVVVVADHNDELLERARAAFPDVTCVPNTGPRGLSGARNTGVAVAEGDVVAFLDDDAAAEPEWAERLLAAFTGDDVIGVGGGVLPDWRAPRPAWFPDEFLWVVGCSYQGLPRTRAEVRNPIGANMAFRRDVFTDAGGFDSDIGRLGKDAAGCEETEFAIRARRARPGSRVLVEPDARCHHHVPADRVTRRYFRRRCRAEGRSKALVSRLAGTDQALSSERVYVRQTLPSGIVRGLRQAARGDRAGAARAWAIVEGALLTATSYAWARVRARRSG
ncbi:glycosyltransferase family 2 protein [Geodermatophilus telluris]|uniref:glycosyltransferase family 2 protein n=1 Tax=Geodermatophilus telluris TaxID=1190417 RepID=UPI001FDF1230|nr:glycosyltransferase [Geodermatophilus telluris]